MDKFLQKSDHFRNAEILEERILQPTAGDVTLSAATQHDAGQRAAERQRQLLE